MVEKGNYWNRIRSAGLLCFCALMQSSSLLLVNKPCVGLVTYLKGKIQSSFTPSAVLKLNDFVSSVESKEVILGNVSVFCCPYYGHQCYLSLQRSSKYLLLCIFIL